MLNKLMLYKGTCIRISEVAEAAGKNKAICCESCHTNRSEDCKWAVFKTGKSALLCCQAFDLVSKKGLTK